MDDSEDPPDWEDSRNYAKGDRVLFDNKIWEVTHYSSRHRLSGTLNKSPECMWIRNFENGEYHNLKDFEIDEIEKILEEQVQKHLAVA